MWLYDLKLSGQVVAGIIKPAMTALRLRRFSLALMAAACLLPYTVALAQPPGHLFAQSTASDLIAAVNALRLANGLPPYTVSTILMQTAQGQADYMAATGQITHSGPGGISLTQRLLAAGYPLAGDLSQGGFRAENIVGGADMTAAAAVQSWQGDALHLNTMLSPNLTEIGAGVARSGSIVYYVIDCALPISGGIPQAYTPPPGEPTVGPYSPGDFIVPVITSTPDQAGKVYHEVQYGQTLWAIAIAYGVKIDQIRTLNNLGEGTEIYQGDKLLILTNAPTPLLPTSTPLTPTASPAVSLTLTSTVEPILSPTMPLPAPSVTAVNIVTPGASNTTAKAGIVIGLILLALLLAGYLTWMRRPE
ncbi:MAG: hypothetical protein Fur0043_04250 [Anaerolineales bacterium]